MCRFVSVGVSLAVSATFLACGPKPVDPPMKSAPVEVQVAWFETQGETCAWRRHGPGPDLPPIATIPAPCGDSVGFALLGDHALVRLARVWRVNVATGEATDLGAPPVGDLVEAGFGEAVQPLAFTLGGGTYANPETLAGPIAFEGREWSTAEVLDGAPVLAHAFAWTDAGWTRIETKVVSTGWDYAENQRGLAAHERLVSIATDDLWREHVGDAVPVDVDPAALSAVLPPEDPKSGEWHAVRTPGGRLAWWMEQVEYLVPTPRVLREAGGAWVPVPMEGWPPSDTPSFQTRGGRVLVSAWGTHPRLLDVATGDVVWHHPEAKGATLWPPPLPPR